MDLIKALFRLKMQGNLRGSAFLTMPQLLTWSMDKRRLRLFAKPFFFSSLLVVAIIEFKVYYTSKSV